MLRKEFNMPLLSLHALAATRGDGLCPEFVDLFRRLARRYSFRIRSASGRNSLRTRKRRPELRIGGATGSGKAETTLRPCPLWVIGGHCCLKSRCPLYRQ
jgi:hypothetical protein